MAGRKRKGGSSPRAARAGSGPTDPEIARLERLLGLMHQHGLAELEVAADGGVRLSKNSGPVYAAPAALAPVAVNAAAPGAAPAAPPAAAPAKPAGEPFLSPMVGTLYRAPTPEAKPFVMEGDSVKAETVLCIIEAMKVMNEIKAERTGKIVQILVENGEAVEYGQPLFLIQRT